MKLCTIIVVYNPDADALSKSLPAFFQETDGIIIWQNSPVSANYINESKFKEKVILAGNGTNIGIAEALNKSIKIAKNHGFTHVLTMDQDSFFDAGIITQYRYKIEKQKESDIGIYGINPYQQYKKLYETDQEFLFVSDTITSGSVFKIANFEKTDYFDENLFIDAVDYEYCYRLRKFYNLRTIIYPNILLNHAVGYRQKTKFGFSIDNYSPLRTYFIIRNHFRIWKDYPELFPKKYKLLLLQHHLIFRIFKIILAEQQKLLKLKALFFGLYHFSINKKGFYEINPKKK